jgi:hypothetical protein
VLVFVMAGFPFPFDARRGLASYAKLIAMHERQLVSQDDKGVIRVERKRHRAMVFKRGLGAAN